MEDGHSATDIHVTQLIVFEDKYITSYFQRSLGRFFHKTINVITIVSSMFSAPNSHQSRGGIKL